MSSATDLRPGVEEARRAVTEAEAAETAASARVDFVREELSQGRATRADMSRAQRKNGVLMETRLTAEAKVRALIRDAEAARITDEARREDERRDLVAELEPQRQEIEANLVALAAGFVRDLDQIYQVALEWTARAELAQPPRGMLTGVLTGSLGHVIGPQSELVNVKNAAGRLAQAATSRR